MALNQILDRSASTVVVSGDTGALANGRDVVTITVTAIDTSGDPIPNAEVFIEETSGNHFLSDSEMPQDPGGDGRLRGPDPVETDANGVGAVTLTSFHEGTLTFDVFVGAPQGGTGGASGAAVFNGNNVDDGGVYTQKTLAADVGASGGYTTTYNTDQAIDAAWLVANNRGSTSIQNTRFQNCTVTVTTEVQFNNCLFEGGSNDYALVVNLDSVALTGSLPTNYLLQDCTITGGAEAGLTGYRIHMIDCLIEECGKHGIKLTKRSGTGNEPVQIVRSVVRKVGDGGSSVQPQGYGVYAVDARYVTLRGMSVECPYHTTGGAIAGYYPEGAVYVGADTEPISHFFFYTSWIDGGVKLDDAGLGIGPEGQMFSPNMYGRNYNPAVPLFDTTDVPSLWTKGQMWMDTGALISNEEAGGNIRTFTGKKYNNLWASGAALDTQATFTLDPAYSLVTLDAFDQFGPLTTNLLDFPPRNNKFDQWTPATINSSPVPTVLAETPLPFPQTGTADRISYNNSAAFADGALVRSKEVGINAGDTVPYEVTVAAANGDGFKTLMALKDDSDQITEQATVAFSNVFSRELLTDLGVDQIAANWGGHTTVTSTVAAPDGSYTAKTSSGGFGSYFRYFLNRGTYPGNPAAAIDSGQEYTYVVYQLAETTSRTYFVDLYASSTANRIQVNYALDTSGVTLNSFSGASTGPAYTAANGFRYENIAGTDWWKISFRVADYSGLGGNLNLNHYKYAEATYWKRYFYQGNHITGQQLLTVDDGVENLLNSTGVFAVSDYPSQTRVSSTGIAAIAAPDGTLTGDSVVGDTTGTAVCNYSMTPSTAGLGWQDGLAVSFSIYVYRPNMTGATGDYARFQLSLLGTAGYNNYIQWRCRANDEVFLFAAASPSSCSFTYTQERNLSYEEIGNTGWIKYTAVLWDFDRNMTSLQLSAERLGGDYELITWNPTLRYGDWVSRGKNHLTANDLSAWVYSANGQLQLSSTPAPDGTLSAYDFNSTTTSEAFINTTSHSIPTTGGAWVYEFWINHTDANWDLNLGRVYFYLRSSTAFTERVIVRFDVAGGATSLSVISTAGPGYTLADNVEQEAIGSDGWWRYRITLFDYSNNAITSWHYWYVKDSGGAGRSTIWNPRLTVGNPADARGYFVSGPQNLLGDGSDYSGWTAGTN